MSIRLGLFYPNTPCMQVKSRSIAAENPDVLDLDVHRQVAQAAEKIGLDYVFLADHWGSRGPHSRHSGVMDPMLFAPVLGMHLLASTEHLRCVTTMHTSWFHPMAIARMGAALDQLSKGRWGINVVTGNGGGYGLISNYFDDLDHDERYALASEVLELLTQAWSRDVTEFNGKYFTIKGELLGPKSYQQPRPLVVSAGASGAGRDFAARHADYIFMPGSMGAEDLQARMADMQRIAREYGRPEGALKMQLHASIVVRETAEEAMEVSNGLAERIEPELVAEYITAWRGISLTYKEVHEALAGKDYKQMGLVGGAYKLHGSADEVADRIEYFYREFGCQGLALVMPIWTPEEIHRLGELVLPRLQAKGIWTPPADRGWTW
ncbi:MAG: LLM class flavin-dependent oxidoreductase [Alphaproteobacteria bacterium]